MVTDTEITLTWAPPTSCLTYGGPLLAYTIQYRVDGVAIFNEQITTSNIGTQYTVPSLTPGTLYQFRVAAINDQGVGAFSPIVLATTIPVIGMYFLASIDCLNTAAVDFKNAEFPFMPQIVASLK